MLPIPAAIRYESAQTGIRKRAVRIVLVALLAIAVAEARAAIEYVAHTSVAADNNNNALAFVVSKPAGTVQGDLMIAQIASRGPGNNAVSYSTPSGWTLLRTEQDTDLRSSVYYKFAGATEPASYTWNMTWGGGGAGRVRAAGGIITYRGVALPPDTVDVHGGSITVPGNGTATAPSVTPAYNNGRVVWFYGFERSDINPSDPPGTKRYETIGTGADADSLTIVASDLAQTTAAATGAQTITQVGGSGKGKSNPQNARGIGQVIVLRAGGCVVASFLINVGSGSASTCQPHSVTVTARDSANQPLTCYTGTVALSTSTSRGDWTLQTGSGSFTPIGSNAGTAQYAYSALDSGVATFALSNQSADDLQISAVDTLIPASLSTSGTVQFRDNAFVLTEDPVQVAGRPQSMGVAMWRRDSGGNCAVATNYAGNRNLKAWLTRDGSDPGGAAPTIGAVALPNAAPGANNLTLTFSAGAASFALGTADVGKYVLNLRDDSRTFASGVDINGSSATLTVRPFGLTITNVQSGAIPNPGGTATTGAAFTPAGETFSAAVTARLWQAADDANNDGIPDAGANLADNAAAPSYRWTTQLSLTTPVTPASGSPGVLGGTLTIAPAGFSGGSATVADLTYSEVGSMTLRADATNFLNTAGVNPAGASGAIGRFYPHRFAVLAGSAVTAACPSGNFSYMDQAGIGLALTIEARNKFNVLTTKYNADYTTGSLLIVAENANDGVDRSARLGSLPVANWANGTFAANTAIAAFSRDAVPDGPFDDLDVGVKVLDPDGAVLDSRDMNSATTGDCVAAANCDAVKIGAPTRVRFGRLRTINATGTSLLDLPLALEAQYFNGVGFVRNTDDGCTAFPATAIGLGNYQGNLGPLASCKTALETPAGNVVFSGGRAQNIKLRKPGGANAGSLDLVVNLGDVATSAESCTAIGAGGASAGATTAANLPFLRSNWGGGAYNQDPLARATFGLYRNANEFIYFRENY